MPEINKELTALITKTLEARKVDKGMRIPAAYVDSLYQELYEVDDITGGLPYAPSWVQEHLVYLICDAILYYEELESWSK